MNFAFKKIKVGLAVMAVLLLAGCSAQAATPSPSTVPSATPASATAPAPESTPPESAPSDTISYENTDYGFTFTLPADWEGYMVVEDRWEGQASDGDSGEETAEAGPMLSIRDPRWTEEVPRQDIPIMILTLDQWAALQNESFHIGAAPVGPTELGRNNKYVFALPARYNYAFPEGYEEVETILSGSPLRPTQLPD